MKNIIILIFVLFSISQSVSAQTLTVSGVSDTDKVLLRWAPEKPSIWKHGNENSYRITRKTIAYKDTPYNIEQLIDSKVVLENAVKIVPSDEFNKEMSDSLMVLAGKLIYDDKQMPEASKHLSLADAVAYTDYIESKFLFSLMVADQSFEVAKAQALGYEDKTAKIDHTYQYTVDLNNDSTSTAATVTIKHSAVTNLDPPQALEGEGSDLSAKLSWEIKSTSHLYNLYNIQRSLDNNRFETINEKPFTYISELEDNPKNAFYTDQLPKNGEKYFYRIVGISPFGVESKPSNVVMVIGVPARLDLAITIDSLYEVNEGDLRVDWKSISNHYSNKIAHFDIYTKPSIDAPETKHNTSPISASKRTYDISQAPSDAYYRLEATDKNGHVYTTLSYAGQVVDKTPPAAPIGTTGKILRDGTVVLSWTSNTEADLNGYKVFYSNVKYGEYSTTETEVNIDTFQIGNIDTSIDTDSIFYKIAAYDHRYNRSVYSEIISLERPDDVAPSNPLIAQILARPEGIRVSWILSNTSDVTQYTLQRKTTESTSWNNIITFTPDDAPDLLPLTPAENIASQYIDEDNLQIRYYNYRLLAEDNFDNQSASPIKTIKPYDDLIRGEIREYIAYIPEGQSLSNDLSTNTGGTFDTEGEEISNVINSTIRLQWEYKNKGPSDLKEFKIYMQEVMPGLSLTDPILDNVPYNLINTLKANDAETVALTQGFGGYMYLHDLSRKPGFKYNFKIMAYHTDGGFSEFTDSVAVPH